MQAASSGRNGQSNSNGATASSQASSGARNSAQQGSVSASAYDNQRQRVRVNNQVRGA